MGCIVACGSGADNEESISSTKNHTSKPSSEIEIKAKESPSVSLPELGVKVEYSDKVKLWGENCTNDPFYGTVEIPIIDYFKDLEDKSWDVARNETYTFRDGDKVMRNGPFTTWYFEMFLQDVSSNVPERKESNIIGKVFFVESDPKEREGN